MESAEAGRKRRENRSPEQEGITTCRALDADARLCENRSPEQEGITTRRSGADLQARAREPQP